MAKQNPKPNKALAQNPPATMPADPVAPQAGAIANAPPSVTEEATAKSTPVLRITAKRETFRRAGHTFGYLPRDIALGVLTEEQIGQLKSEPMLSCVEIEVEPE